MNSPIAAYKPNQEIEVAEPSPAATSVVIGFNSAAGFELMQRGAKLLAASTLVPKEYQNNISNCVIALNMANRLGADPMMVMQNLYIVHGRPSWSAQFLISSFNQCGRFSAIRYKWLGTQGADDWGCQAYAIERSSGEVITGPTITILLSKKEGWYGKNGSKWQTMPELMLMYRAAAWLVRTHAPEISMGLQTTDEVLDAAIDADGSYSVDTGMRETVGKIRESVQRDVGEFLPIEEPLKAPTPAITAKYSDVARALQTSNTLDELNESADLIREVPNEVHRQQLNQIYQEREAALNQ